MALFGQYDIGKLYRETINVCLEGVPISPTERSALFTVVCLSEITTGICYDPGSNRPADYSDLFLYSTLGQGNFHAAMDRLARLEIISVWNDRGRMLITLNEYIRASLSMIWNNHATPALIVARRGDGLAPTKGRRFGYVYVARAENGLHKIGRSKTPEDRVRGFAGAIMPFIIELIHTIPSNDYAQAERLLHQRYAHCRRVGEWFDLSERDLDKLLDVRQLNF